VSLSIQCPSPGGRPSDEPGAGRRPPPQSEGEVKAALCGFNPLPLAAENVRDSDANIDRQTRGVHQWIARLLFLLALLFRLLHVAETLGRKVSLERRAQQDRRGPKVYRAFKAYRGNPAPKARKDHKARQVQEEIKGMSAQRTCEPCKLTVLWSATLPK
jgi:hypothetical protein